MRVITASFAGVMFFLVMTGVDFLLAVAMAIAILALAAEAVEAFVVRDRYRQESREYRRWQKHVRSQRYLSEFAAASSCRCSGDVGQKVHDELRASFHSERRLAAKIKNRFSAYRVRDQNGCWAARVGLHWREPSKAGYG